MALPGFEHIEGLSAKLYRQRDDFVDYIRRNASIDKPIKVKRLAVIYGVGWSQIPALRRACWIDGIPIASCGAGYYYAETAEEFLPTLVHVNARARAEKANVELLVKMLNKLWPERDQQQMRLL